MSAPQVIPASDGAAAPLRPVATGAEVVTERRLWFVVAAFTVARFLLAAILPLLPQEAYYWTWSLDPALSYFDHPPLTAYSIWLTTAVLGQTEFAIKSAAVLWSLVWNVLWVRLVLDMFGDRRLALWSLVALNLVIGYEASALFMTPDTPLVALWVATVWAVWRAAATGQARWWYLAGLCLGLTWLGKYTGALLVPAVFLFLLVSSRQRRWLSTVHPYLAGVLALAVFSPVLVWNGQHDWASLAFQGSSRLSGMKRPEPHVLQLVGTQLLYATPYLLYLSVYALVAHARKPRALAADDRALLLWLVGAVPLVAFTLVSFRTLVKLNWLVVAYWPLVILGVRRVLEKARGERELRLGLGSSAAIVIVALVLMAIPNAPLGAGNSWSGWDRAAARVHALQAELEARGERSFVFAPNHKVSSMLWFHRAGQPRTYAQDILGENALQYDFLPPPPPLAGATGILVTDDHGGSGFDPYAVTRHFQSIKHAETIEIRGIGGHVRRIDIWLLGNYAGYPRVKDGAAAPSKAP